MSKANANDATHTSYVWALNEETGLRRQKFVQRSKVCKIRLANDATPHKVTASSGSQVVTASAQFSQLVPSFAQLSRPSARVLAALQFQRNRGRQNLNPLQAMLQPRARKQVKIRWLFSLCVVSNVRYQLAALRELLLTPSVLLTSALYRSAASALLQSTTLFF